jgi:hypothetical protein
MKKHRTYYLTEQTLKQLEQMSEKLTMTKHGKSSVLDRMIQFACDNAADFEDYFVFDPTNQKVIK